MNNRKMLKQAEKNFEDINNLIAKVEKRMEQYKDDPEVMKKLKGFRKKYVADRKEIEQTLNEAKANYKGGNSSSFSNRLSGFFGKFRS